MQTVNSSSVIVQPTSAIVGINPTQSVGSSSSCDCITSNTSLIITVASLAAVTIVMLVCVTVFIFYFCCKSKQSNHTASKTEEVIPCNNSKYIPPFTFILIIYRPYL